jgi:hypothetical protein
MIITIIINYSYKSRWAIFSAEEDTECLFLMKVDELCSMEGNDRMKLWTRIAGGTLSALLPAFLLGAALSVPALSAEPSLEGARTEAERGGYRLMNTGELLERYSDDGVDMLLVDTRQGWEYRTGHIAGAVSFPMEPTWWSRWKSRRALRRLVGPDRDKLLVFY